MEIYSPKVPNEWVDVVAKGVIKINVIVICNYGAADTQIYMAIYPNRDGGVQNQHMLIGGQTILANETLTYDFGIKIKEGSIITFKSTLGTVNFAIDYE